MYILLSRIADGVEPLRRQFEEHVKRKGLAAVAKVTGTDADAVEPAAYVEALLQVHSNYLGVVNRSFRGEPGFLAALDKACRIFMNKNEATGENTSKCPELLAKHSDGLLKKSNKNAEEASLEEALNQVVSKGGLGEEMQGLLLTAYAHNLMSDGGLQVHRGQGRLPKVLFKDARQASRQLCLCL